MATIKSYVLTIALVLLCISALIFGGCADNAAPTYFEPVISGLSAGDVTRNSAIVCAHIENRGDGSLEFFRFICSTDDGTTIFSEQLPNPSGRVQALFEGLKPGTRYTLIGEGTRGNARIRSEAIYFSTMSNDRPSISQLSVLSSGPTAVIMQFQITSDGGEPLLETGCYVSDIPDNQPMKILAPLPASEQGYVKILINSLTPLSEYIIRPYAINAIGETVGDPFRIATDNAVRLVNAGELDKVLDFSAISDGRISISGPLDGDDFKYLRQLTGSDSPILSHIDLSDACIVEGGASYDGSRFTVKDVVSSGLFADCPHLVFVSLPMTCTSIERDAFARSVALKEIVIPVNVTSLYPSGECSALESITVADGNVVFGSYDGVLFNASLSDIVWFPPGRTKPFNIPSSVTKICESTFTYSLVEKIVLPPTLCEIERYAFYGSALKEIEIPSGIRNIPEGMLQNCLCLKKVRFGASTEFIGNYILDNSPVEHLYVDAAIPPYVSPDAFSFNPDLTDNCILHVSTGCRKIYRNHPQWGKFKYITEERE